jgi:hypothetical protein
MRDPLEPRFRVRATLQEIQSLPASSCAMLGVRLLPFNAAGATIQPWLASLALLLDCLLNGPGEAV